MNDVEGQSRSSQIARFDGLRIPLSWYAVITPLCLSSVSRYKDYDFYSVGDFLGPREVRQIREITGDLQFLISV